MNNQLVSLRREHKRQESLRGGRDNLLAEKQHCSAPSLSTDFTDERLCWAQPRAPGRARLAATVPRSPGPHRGAPPRSGGWRGQGAGACPGEQTGASGGAEPAACPGAESRRDREGNEAGLGLEPASPAGRAGPRPHAPR